MVKICDVSVIFISKLAFLHDNMWCVHLFNLCRICRHDARDRNQRTPIVTAFANHKDCQGSASETIAAILTQLPAPTGVSALQHQYNGMPVIEYDIKYNYGVVVKVMVIYFWMVKLLHCILFRVFCYLTISYVNNFCSESTSLRLTIMGLFFTLLLDMGFLLQGYVCATVKPHLVATILMRP